MAGAAGFVVLMWLFFSFLFHIPRYHLFVLGRRVVYLKAFQKEGAKGKRVEAGSAYILLLRSQYIYIF